LTGGTLFVVGTPIGNLEDLSQRARSVLGDVDVIAAEDTRRTKRLLAHINVRTPLVAYHEHNEVAAVPDLLDRLAAGETVALVSDAGMPLLSDPGFALVSAALEHGNRVETVPGPCAVTAALSIAGLPTDRYVFEGFLPRKAGQRAARLAALANEERTLVFFESVHRLEASLDAMTEVFGADRSAVLARELTKIHEATYRGTLGGLCRDLGSAIPLLGEFVVLVGGASAPKTPEAAEIKRVFGLLKEHLPPREAALLTASITGQSRNEIYRLTLAGDDEAGEAADDVP